MGRYPTHGLTGAAPAGLAWLAGSWVGKNGEDRVEEHWSPPGGNSLVGMFRWVGGGRVRFYELIVVEQEAALVYLRIKHFDPGLVGWEEKDRAHSCVLVQLEGEEAVFLELDKPDARWVIYRREGPDRLVSYFVGQDGAMTDTGLFEYTRQ